MSCETNCGECPARAQCSIRNTPGEPSAIEKKFAGKNVIGVMSGKGGVGKSTIAACIAHQISKAARTCIIDMDIAGPSIARVTGVECSQVIAETLVPSRTGSLDVFTPEEKGGYRKGAEVLGYLEKIQVGEYDVIVMDTPPGTSDVHIALAKHVPNLKVVLVSTPHKLSVADTNRQISFCQKSGLEIVGVVENMSGYKCGNCHHVSAQDRGSARLNLDRSVPAISVPISQGIAKGADSGLLAELEKHINIEKLKIFTNATGEPRAEPADGNDK
ncbi:uncharacterized protein NEMAJ01_1253 [Nematocida major]|uniref:uncharacterized protein n=1 Tax=Nematocida major TaxID=1912982 RepID=UPI0020088393|nr:uncharacterized protein NEMAJ01_1253 [Nematocida major]KAH9386357.1 hypothetical protein NEMAJ01_1253 [Nematocida major]